MDMHELIPALEALQTKINDLGSILLLTEKKTEILTLEAETTKPNFWDDPEQAQATMKRLAALQEEASTWQQLDKETRDTLEMARLDAADSAVNMREELETNYKRLLETTLKLEVRALLHGRHDAKNAIVAIHAGAGGTEAQDWAEMLRRMILRYAERKGWKVTILDESLGQEAGLKSCLMRVEGYLAYGYLQSEHGTHRLVRISPFDAEQMRHTSFALIEVIPEVEIHEFSFDPKDLRIDTFMSGGKGGQSVNTTYSAVRIVHIPTGIAVQCQNERSQLQNKDTAMRILHSKLQKLKDEEDEKERLELRGEYKSAEWGNQIRSYVLHPYKMVKDLRSRFETTEPEDVLDGDLDPFVEAYLRSKNQKKF